jgi:hypothetical protein
MRKTYLSLQMSRMWSADMPVGDPHGGPANGERAMALIVVATSAMSIAAGAATFSLAAGFTMANIVAGALLVGGTLSIAGKLTGNDKLMKWGNTLQLVGNVANFATGAYNAATTQGASFGDIMKGGMKQVSDTYAKGLANLGIGTSVSAPVDVNAAVPPTVTPTVTPEPSLLTPAPAPAPVTPAPTQPGLLESVKTMAKDAGKWVEQNKTLTYIGAKAVEGGLKYLSAQEAAEIAEQQRQRRGAAPYVVNNPQDAETARAAGVNFVYMPTPVAPKRVATQVASGPTVAVPTVTAPMPV